LEEGIFMTIILKQLFDLFKLLNSENGENQVAAGVALGFVLGMSPIFSLQALLIFILILVFRIQFGAAMIASFFFAFMAYLFDPLFHQVGKIILTLPALQQVFTQLYNLPLIPFTRFNNTIVMGGGIVGFVFALPVFLVSRKLILTYQSRVLQKLKETKIWKAFQLTSFYKWYCTYDSLTH
jgi:uncharacterized protein (TIGR03546 family)